MDAATFIHRIRESGFTLTEVDGNLAVSPAARLEPGQRRYIVDHKADLVAALRASESLLPAGPAGNDIEPANHRHQVPPDLEQLALVVCKLYGDTNRDKADMLADLAGYPPDAWPALAAHFQRKLDPVACATCRHARRHQHPMLAACTAGVDSGTVVGGYWATDRHLCAWYSGEEVAA